MAAQCVDLSACCGVPDPRRAVIGSGDDARPSGEKDALSAPRLMAAQCVDLAAGCGIPDPRREILGGGDDARSAGGERRTPHPALVPNQAEALRTRRGEVRPTRRRTKIRVLLRRGDDTRHSFMNDASEATEKLPWEFLRVSRKRWE